MRLVMIGYGKIARDQHVAAIAATEEAELVAVVSEHGGGPAGVPQFPTLEAFYASGIAADAATHCNTPAARYATARSTIAHGLATLLEKPPFATLGQCAEMVELADARGAVLATSWHSQHNEAVRRARAWLAGKTIREARMDWVEDVRKWHPGQAWIWQPGGFGVFDPGINGISILTTLLPFAVHMTAARVEVPANRAMPIAARMELGGPDSGFSGSIRLDWRGHEEEEWSIRIACREGELALTGGGRKLAIDDEVIVEHGDEEYRSIYRSFAQSVREGRSAVDLAPLRLVADAFMLAETRIIEPFED